MGFVHGQAKDVAGAGLASPPQRRYGNGMSHRVVAITPEPQISDAEIAARLATPKLRGRELRRLLYGDHHILRARFSNAHRISAQMWRSNQPSPEQIANWAKRGIKTIINLRGVSDASWHVLERGAASAYWIQLVTFRMNSRMAPRPSVPRLARELFASIDYPAVMHCKSGADRAGIAAVLYRHFHLDEPISQARAQLSLKYLHLRMGKPGILDAWCDHYVETGERQGIDLITWSEQHFDWADFNTSFKASGFGSFVQDKLLRRE
jgi:protein tyrosine/serine phosphatase